MKTEENQKNLKKDLSVLSAISARICWSTVQAQKFGDARRTHNWNGSNVLTVQNVLKIKRLLRWQKGVFETRILMIVVEKPWFLLKMCFGEIDPAIFNVSRTQVYTAGPKPGCGEYHRQETHSSLTLEEIQVASEELDHSVQPPTHPGCGLLNGTFPLPLGISHLITPHFQGDVVDIAGMLQALNARAHLANLIGHDADGFDECRFCRGN